MSFLINDSIALRALRDPGVLKYAPNLQPLVEELHSRDMYHRSKPGCQACKGGVYTKDLVSKVAQIINSIEGVQRDKLKAYLGIR